MSKLTKDGKRRDYLGIEKVCPVCKKTFLLPPFNVYKLPNSHRKDVHYCSYSCFRKVQKEQEKKNRYESEY